MSKEELLSEIRRLNATITELKNGKYLFLEEQNKQLKKLAEKAGSEMSKWKHECLVLREKVRKYETN